MTCSDNTIPLKTGSTAAFKMVYTDTVGNPIPLEGYEIFMDFINAKNGEVLASTRLNQGITITDSDAGKYEVNAGSTADWPVGKMPVDIKYAKAGQSQHTEDLIIDMIQGRTK